MGALPRGGQGLSGSILCAWRTFLAFQAAGLPHKPQGRRAGHAPGSPPTPCWRRRVCLRSRASAPLPLYTVSEALLRTVPWCRHVPKGPHFTFGLEAIFTGVESRLTVSRLGPWRCCSGVLWLASVLRETGLPCSCCVMVLPPPAVLRFSLSPTLRNDMPWCLFFTSLLLGIH